MAETEYKLDKNAYASFDAVSLKQYIIDKLNDDQVFTDQVFEGSNLSSIIDIIAYSYHTLLFYLNQTSSESLFTEASIYENINRIVKLINYNPRGFQTSVLLFQAIANEFLLPDIYTIKRYSYFNINGIFYTFLKDVTFSKSTNSIESLNTLYEENLLYQGRIFEYPLQLANGEDFEIVLLALRDTNNEIPINIEDSSINVYVKDFISKTISEYKEVSNIFNSPPGDTVFEKRYNENKLYEIKFGNGVFGKKLNENDEIYIYYLQSDGQSGVISPGVLDGNILNIYTSPRFEEISSYIYNKDTNFLTPEQSSNIFFLNQNTSTNPKSEETIDEIKSNSQKLLFSYNRLVNETDYEVYIDKFYNNIVKSVSVLNNNNFINSYINYFYKLGLDRPNDDSRFLFNQVNFSSNNQMNDVHIFMVPKIKYVDENNNFYFLSQSQKNTILEELNEYKMLNVNLVPQDPVYMAFGPGILGDEKLTSEISNNTFFVFKRNPSTRVSLEFIKQNANNIFKNYFDNLELGDLVDLIELKSQLLSINGVEDVITRRNLNGINVETSNLSFVKFNLIYEENDISIITSNVRLEKFQYPFLINGSIINNIIVEDV